MWLIQSNILKAMQDAKASGNFKDIKSFVSTDNNQEVQEDSNIAKFTIKGVLTESEDIFAEFFGGGNVVYSDLISFIEMANNNDSIDEILLEINSPGGTVDGMFEAMEAIRDSEKPVISLVKKAASAAYFLASQSDKILSINKMSSVGSVGAVIETYNDKNVYTVTNTDSPNKRPDITTEEGKAILRSELDDIYEVFAGMAAAGRNVSIDQVRNGFGKGSMLLADDAIKAGMIDGYYNDTIAVEAKNMDLKELKLKHPDLYASALKAGAEEEKDRVVAHITLGKQANALDIAFKAIEDGSTLTSSLTAQYLAASMNKKDIDARSSEDCSAADNVKEASSKEDDVNHSIFAKFAEKKGLKMEVGRG